MSIGTIQSCVDLVAPFSKSREQRMLQGTALAVPVAIAFAIGHAAIEIANTIDRNTRLRNTYNPVNIVGVPGFDEARAKPKI